MLGTHVCSACSLGRLRTVSGEILAGSRVGGGGLCLGQGLLMWAFQLLRRASTSKVLGGEVSGGQRRRRHGILKVSTREPASLGLGGGLGPEDRLYGGPCGAWSREVAFSLRSGHAGGETSQAGTRRDAQPLGHRWGCGHLAPPGGWVQVSREPCRSLQPADSRCLKEGRALGRGQEAHRTPPTPAGV